MTFKSFLFGMLATFGCAWMFMIAIPVAQMGNLDPVKMTDEEDSPIYEQKFSGRVSDGSRIYAANGCYACHTQLIRPTYAGKQIWRDDIAGVVDTDGNDTRRETTQYDYAGEEYAQIGLMRMGPDLSNLAHRVVNYAKQTDLTPEQWLAEHLYDPRNNDLRIGKDGERLEMNWSNCPSQKHMFEKKTVAGQGNHVLALQKKKCGKEITPKEDALVLVSYLMSLKRDDAVPESMDNSPKKGEEEK